MKIPCRRHLLRYLCRALSNLFSFALTRVSQQAESATLVLDYNLLTTAVSLSGDPKVRFEIVENSRLENNETFTMTLSNQGDSRVNVGSIGSTTILIMDNDGK